MVVNVRALILAGCVPHFCSGRPSSGGCDAQLLKAERQAM